MQRVGSLKTLKPFFHPNFWRLKHFFFSNKFLMAMMTNWNPAKWKSGRKLSATLYFSAKTAEAPAAGDRFDKIFACSTKNYHATIEYLLATISIHTHFFFPNALLLLVFLIFSYCAKNEINIDWKRSLHSVWSQKNWLRVVCRL